MVKRTLRQLAARAEPLLFHLLLFAAVGAAVWLAQHHSVAWDWSQNGRNSLSHTSRELLSRLQEPLRMISFSPEDPLLRQRTRELIERYRRHRPDIALQFINPSRNPALTRELGIRLSGELRIEYQGRGENLRLLDEQTISNAIQRLIQQDERWIALPEGHGERSLSGRANHDLGNFGAALKRKGYRLQPVSLAQMTQLPANTSLLLIASPQVDFPELELNSVISYIERGGNLLWLLEPGPSAVLAQLARYLGVTPLPGTVVDANAARLGLDDPAMALVTDYPDHPATRDFKLTSVYPHAAALQIANGEWQQQALLQTLAGSWNETGALRGEVTRRAELGEIAGPLDIGIALTRMLDGREQRLLIVGDGDFLSNTYLGNGGNLDLGLNLVRWLSGDDQLLDIPAKTAGDLRLELSPRVGALIGLGSLALLPMLLAGSGVMIWWRRRRS